MLEEKPVISEETEEMTEVEEKTGGVVEIGAKAAGLVKDAADAAVEAAGGVFDGAKHIVSKAVEGIQDARIQKLYTEHNPVFLEQVLEGNLKLPNIIYVEESDQAKEIELFRNAIGFNREINKTKVLSICMDDLDKFGIVLYPGKAESLYYASPIQPNFYIDINNYLVYLAEFRVAELETIAHSLGATYFKVKLVEKNSFAAKKKANAKAKIGAGKEKTGAEVSTDKSNTDYTEYGVINEGHYPGKEPTEPVLRIWKNNPQIMGLINMRMNGGIDKKVYSLNYNTGSGISLTEAGRIDGIFKQLKFDINGSFKEEVRKEENRMLEYTVDFKKPEK